ncbi:hypothetical protein Poly24_48660 [Rosistilla carotiformis]|uniref:Uncharacterized protein n=1 Tax=Rosistilla carotiformis TaxID=2528017 RepID=A0A518K015_9BACT|nr:hypothetical protein [Rosistilla carotiformis]QDV71132.1 hypothetical protein Poly24_48660 [Rosistilla carotiformis]
MSEAPYQSQPADSFDPPKSSGSCWLYGCLGSIALLSILVVCGGVGTYWFVNNQIQKYTSETAADLPVVEIGEERLAELESRVGGFKTAVEAESTPPELILTADEINAMIAKQDDLRGRVFVKIADGQVEGDVSIPVAGRFFNGSATFDVNLVDGMLFVNLKAATIKGEPVPDMAIEAIGKENLAKELNTDPDMAKFIKSLDSVRIEGDKIILSPKVAAPEGAAGQPDASTEPADDSQPADAASDEPAAAVQND